MTDDDKTGAVLVIMFFSIVGLLAGVFGLLSERDLYVSCDRIEIVSGGTCDEFREEISLQYHKNKVNELGGE